MTAWCRGMTVAEIIEHWDSEDRVDEEPEEDDDADQE